MVVPLGAYATWTFYKNHKSPLIASLGVAGTSLIGALNAPDWLLPGAHAQVMEVVHSVGLSHGAASLVGAGLMLSHHVFARH